MSTFISHFRTATAGPVSSLKSFFRGEWITNSRDNVSRPDGYNSTEKMISWARVGWSHIPIYAFVSLTILAGAVLIAGHDEGHNPHLQEVFNLDYDYILPGPIRWTQDYMPMLIALALPVVGWAAAKIGRLATILIIFLLTAALAPLCSAARGEEMFIAGFAFPVFLFAPSMMLLALIYCYEFTPIKWRVPAILSVSLFDTVGGLMIALCERIVPEMRDKEPRRDWLWMVHELAGLLPVSIALIVGLCVARDSPISLVNRGAAGAAYDQLEYNGKQLTTGPVPIPRSEFVHAAEQETLNAMGVCENLKRSSGPLMVVAATAFVWAICDKSVLYVYYYISHYYLGDVPDGAADMIPMRLVKHCVSMASLGLALFGWMTLKDIRFAPPLAMLVLAMGTLTCATVKVMDDTGHPLLWSEVSSANTVVAGVVLIYLALPALQVTMRIVAMDLFCNKSRSQGMFLVLALEIFFGGLMSRFQYEVEGADWEYITLAAVVALVAGFVFGAFYLTHWFDHSILCRDPETDACWLVKDPATEGQQIVSSRATLRS